MNELLEDNTLSKHDAVSLMLTNQHLEQLLDLLPGNFYIFDLCTRQKLNEIIVTR